MKDDIKSNPIIAPALQPLRKVLPLIPLRNIVLFPSVETSLFFGRKESMNSLLHAYDNTNRLVVITTQQNSRIEKPQYGDIYNVGVLAKIEHILQTDGSLHAIVKGISRVNILKLTQTDPFFVVEYVDLPAVAEPITEIQQSAEALLSQLKKAFAMGRQFDLPAMMQLSTGVSSSDLADQVSFSIEAKIAEKQVLLETLIVSQRLRAATEYLIKEMKVAELERSIEEKTQEKFNTGVKRNVLEERKRQIEKELKRLGQSSGGEFSDLEKKIKNKNIPEDIRKKLDKELERLSEMGSMAPESSYIRTYLETVAELPWGNYTKSNISLSKAAKILDEDHYGIKDVKERILEYLAVLEIGRAHV